MSQKSAIWQDLLGYVKEHVPEVEFQTWFQQIAPLSIEEGALIIAVPNSFVRDWCKNNYSEVIERGLKELGADYPKVSFEISSIQVQQQNLFDDSSEAVNKADAAKQYDKQLPNVSLHPRPQLNPKYTFNNFVVGSNNNLSHAAAQAAAKTPGKAYNPLFIYGDAGLGKTHLMHAVGRAALEIYPKLIVEYVSSETFTNELITAIREDKMVQFRRSYRNIDILLIDDVQFIEGKERTQEEFFHTFNDLHQAGKQIILSSDRPPKDIPKLEGRLRNRFEWGLITDIQAPDLETRMAILKMNAEYRKVKVDDEVIEYIARNVTNNIRELEGALIRVIVYSSMNDLPLNSQNAAKALSDIFMPSDADLSMNSILQACATHFNIPAQDVISKGRRAEMVNARQLAMYLIRELTDHSYPEIGSFFSNRDHTTVMHAVNKVENTLKEDDGFAQHIREIKNKLL